MADSTGPRDSQDNRLLAARRYNEFADDASPNESVQIDCEDNELGASPET